MHLECIFHNSSIYGKGSHTDPWEARGLRRAVLGTSGRGRSTSRWLVRFGYDGTVFHGWARQPGLRTVEGEIRRGLVRGGAVGNADALSLEVASRTDRGVSARSNALALRSELPGATLLRTLNGIAPELAFTAATPIPEDFRVRHAVRRTYRYYEANRSRHAARQNEAARLFTGTVDVRSFGRSIPMAEPAWRTIESVTIHPLDQGSLITVRAPAFVWGMVRKIVATLREVDAGRLAVPRLRSALEGKVRLTLPMAEPEPLVLWEVEYARPWTVFWQGPNRPQVSADLLRKADQWVRARVLESLETSTPAREGAATGG
jgi:tRNA pseudouridine38-40 synthase